MVTPCQSQFLSRIPKKDGVSQARNLPETTEPVYDRDTFQDGDPGHNERPTETGRLDGFDRSLHTFQSHCAIVVIGLNAIFISSHNLAL